MDVQPALVGGGVTHLGHPQHTTHISIRDPGVRCGVCQSGPPVLANHEVFVGAETDRHSLIHLSQAWPGLDAQKMGAGVVASTSLMRRLNTKTSLTCLSHRVRKGQSQDQNAV